MELARLILQVTTDPATGDTAPPAVFGIPWDQLLFGTTGLTAYLMWENLQLRKERTVLIEESRAMAKRALDALAAAGGSRENAP